MKKQMRWLYEEVWKSRKGWEVIQEKANRKDWDAEEVEEQEEEQEEEQVEEQVEEQEEEQEEEQVEERGEGE